jgi:DNA-binding winged helix-turn-helix (wHTH) protein/tetratricopeptide (TPR) repeat protein
LSEDRSAAAGFGIRLGRVGMSGGGVDPDNRPIDLAREPDFTLSGATVSPATLQVHSGGEVRTLEPRIMQVLVALAKRRGQVVSRDELNISGWGGRVVGDDSLYRCVIKVRKLGEETGAFTVENVRTVGYRLDEKGAAPRPVGAPPRRRRWGPWVGGAAGLFALAVIAAAVWLVFGTAHPAWQNGRVEVRALRPGFPDPSLNQVSGAFGDAIVRALAASGVETTVENKGEGAEFLISGAVNRDGNDYATYVQVADRRTSAVLWSKRFDRGQTDLAGYPEQVANRVGDTLYCAMGSRSRSRKRLSSAAFSAFLNACAARRPPYGETDRFFEVTRKLTESAPDLSVAFSMHAVAAGVLSANADPKLKPGYFQATKAAAERALQLDPKNGEAYFAVGIAYGVDHDWLEREAAFSKAAALAPDLSVVNNYQYYVLSESGRTTEAAALNLKIAGRDVFSPFVLQVLAEIQARDGDRAEMQATLHRIDQMDPDTARLTRFDIALWFTPFSVATLQQLESSGRGLMSDAKVDCAMAFARTMVGSNGTRRGLPSTCETAPIEWRMQMLTMLGDVDGAFALAPHGPGEMSGVADLFDPSMAAFRADPRFMRLAQDIGLVEYWRKSGHWPDFCAEPSRPYDCQAEANKLTS